MTVAEKSYIAGIIDGEGTVTLTKDKEFRFPVVEVTSTTWEIIEYLHQHAGGRVANKNEEKRNPNWKHAWNWRVSNRKAIELPEEVVPYMVEPKKIARANLIIADYIRLTPRNGRYSDQQRAAKHAFEEQFFQL